MGLFDDILKKPNSPTGQQVNPPVDPLTGSTPTGGQGSTQGTSGTGPTPPVIKISASTVFGVNSDVTAINSQNTEPPLPKVHAEEDSSSVLMPTTPQASTPIAPVAPPQEPMIVTPSIEVSPVQVQSPSLIAEEKATATPSSLQKEEEKLINESSSSSTPASPDALNIPQGPSLFDHLMNEDEPVVTATATPVGETPAAFSFENPTLPEAPQKSSQETSSAVETKVSVTTPSPKSPMTSTTHYSTPREFIEKSLENIEVMLETIDKRHGSKMTEAEGYRMEKMRFAELEKNAYAEAEIMDRERDHTLRMKAIFEKELDTDEANRTGKSAYTEKHVSHPHVSHKHSTEENEENVVAAS